jgi:four helix bundle protein
VAPIKRFEDIEAWQDARSLIVSVYSVTNQGNFARDYGLRDQLRRASISIMSNIAEGFERSSRKEFIRFLEISKSSAGEVRSQLYVAKDLAYIEDVIFDDLSTRVTTISKKLSSFIKYLQGDK